MIIEYSKIHFLQSVSWISPNHSTVLFSTMANLASLLCAYFLLQFNWFPSTSLHLTLQSSDNPSQFLSGPCTSFPVRVDPFPPSRGQVSPSAWLSGVWPLFTKDLWQLYQESRRVCRWLEGRGNDGWVIGRQRLDALVFSLTFPLFVGWWQSDPDFWLAFTALAVFKRERKSDRCLTAHVFWGVIQHLVERDLLIIAEGWI